jgi:hypothetical protein
MSFYFHVVREFSRYLNIANRPYYVPFHILYKLSYAFLENFIYVKSLWDKHFHICGTNIYKKYGNIA